MHIQNYKHITLHPCVYAQIYFIYILFYIYVWCVRQSCVCMYIHYILNILYILVVYSFICNKYYLLCVYIIYSICIITYCNVYILLPHTTHIPEVHCNMTFFLFCFSSLLLFYCPIPPHLASASSVHHRGDYISHLLKTISLLLLHSLPSEISVL